MCGFLVSGGCKGASLSVNQTVVGGSVHLRSDPHGPGYGVHCSVTRGFSRLRAWQKELPDRSKGHLVDEKTLSGGSLGSCIDEERSQLC